MEAICTQSLSGWNRYPVQCCKVVRPEYYVEFRPTSSPGIARGQGRSYSDAALNENGRVVLTERLNRFRSFDITHGILKAEAGLTLYDLLRTILPRGWFLPVTPGTGFVSLGGAFAADVHGKNHHHDGAFSQHVTDIELCLPDGEHVTCSPSQQADLFWASAGGMGLTGFIGEVGIQLRPVPSAYIKAQHHCASDLEHLFTLLSDTVYDAPYTVAWIDCLSQGARLGRGILMGGRHAELDELPTKLARYPYRCISTQCLGVPFDFPTWVMNPYTVSLFNHLYYRLEGRKQIPFIVHCQPFFYPLDNVLSWNRLYGRRGFLQYQCVLPEPGAYDGIRELLERLTATRQASFLAVLKRMGPEGQGHLSFPMAGYTLALDITFKGDKLFSLLDTLDEIVIQRGGRVYLAKDARLKPDMFRAMYPRYPEWLAIKQRVDPSHRVASSLSRRLQIGETA